MDGAIASGTTSAPEPGLRRVIATNPSPMTLTGTATYLVGRGRVAVIDPGPDDPRHRAAVLAALEPGERVAAVLVTHAHRDHSGGAAALGRATGAPVLAHGDPTGAMRPAMAALAAAGGIGGGEGIDRDFRPDQRIAEGARLTGPGWTLEAVACPGHLADHLAFHWVEAGALFTGDTVMGWASTLISPPEGDLAAYMATLDRLESVAGRVFYPGHGPAIDAPAARVSALRAHRQGREAAILAALAAGPASARALVPRLYADTDRRLWPAAMRTVLAHLLHLAERGAVASAGPPGPDAIYRLTGG